MTGTTMAGAALAVWLVGLLLAFGLRTWAHRRATGTTGYRGTTGRPGSAAWWGGVLFPVALLLGTLGPLLALTGTAAPPAALARPEPAIAGLLLAVAGIAVVLAAQTAMGASWRIGVDERERTDLVTRGPFGRVRNPVFTGMAAVAAGVALMVPTVLSAVALVCLVAAVQLQVRVVEEPYLRRVHGAAYSDYLAATGRFLPRLRRVRAGA